MALLRCCHRLDGPQARADAVLERRHAPEGRGAAQRAALEGRGAVVVPSIRQDGFQTWAKAFRRVHCRFVSPYSALCTTGA